MTEKYFDPSNRSSVFFGRQSLQAALATDLKNQKHVWVFGPTGVGKTVLSHRISDGQLAASDGFDARMHWHLRDEPIPTNASFFLQMAAKLADALETVDTDLSSSLRSAADGEHFDALKDTVAYLEQSAMRVLCCMDHYDSLYDSAGVSEALYSQMRTLGEFASFRYFMTSRKSLDLYGGDIVDSPFAGLFLRSHSIRAFEKDDMLDVLEPLTQAGWSFEAGFATELFNQTGGNPNLVMRFLAAVSESDAHAGLDHSDCRRLLQDHDGISQPLVARVMSSAIEEESMALRRLANGHQVHSGTGGDIHGSLAAGLAAQGWITLNGNSLQLRSRIMKEYARSLGEVDMGFAEKFSSPEAYGANIMTTQQLRFGSLNLPHSQLAQALRDMITKETPTGSLKEARDIANTCAGLISDALCPSGVPQGWTSKWQAFEVRAGRSLNFPTAKPNSTSDCLRMLRLLFDDRYGIRREEIGISNATYLLLSWIHDNGNFGQHRHGEEIPQTYQAILVASAIELAERVCLECGVA